MAPSARLVALTDQLQMLRDHLLPAEFSDDIGDYAEEVPTLTLAYRVLVHAEIESYLEDRAWEVAQAAVSAYKVEARIPKALLCLLAFSGNAMREPPPALTPTQPSQRKEWEKRLSILSKIDDAVTSFYQVIQDNHGIKEKNVLSMLLPIGIETEDIDQTWLSTMNSFGERRGEAAHSSTHSSKTQQPPDPGSEYDTVGKLVSGLQALDEVISDLLNR